MGDRLEAGLVGELADGAMKEILAQGRRVLLARVGDAYLAAENRCPHMGGRLSDGKLQGAVITCPLHGSQFDLRTGEVVRWLKGGGLLSKIGTALSSPKSLTVYKVRVENGKILIEA